MGVLTPLPLNLPQEGEPLVVAPAAAPALARQLQQRMLRPEHRMWVCQGKLMVLLVLFV